MRQVRRSGNQCRWLPGKVSSRVRLEEYLRKIGKNKIIFFFSQAEALPALSAAQPVLAWSFTTGGAAVVTATARLRDTASASRKHWLTSAISCGDYIMPGEDRVSVGGDSYHASPALHCYSCQTCRLSLTGRKVSRLGPGSLVCSSVCHRLLTAGPSDYQREIGRYKQLDCWLFVFYFYSDDMNGIPKSSSRVFLILQSQIWISH